MGELFLTLYVIHNDLKIKHIPISFMSENRCDNTTIINLLSSANCLTYKKWKKETKSLATERITGNRDDSTMKKIAINMKTILKETIILKCRKLCACWMKRFGEIFIQMMIMD